MTQETAESGAAALADSPLLEVTRLGKRYGPVVALDGVSFHVDRGETVALLGDNGAGKSTLVKILSGVTRADAGEVRIDGRRVTLSSPSDAKAAGIETVYQDLSLCMNMDVVANFFMGRELTRNVLGLKVARDREMEAETKRALSDIGVRLPDVRTRAEHLSGGQRQGIELGRFVHWGGKLVLLDEPFAALGVEQTKKGLELVERVKNQGVAVVVITHNMLHAFQVADRVVVMRNGAIAGVKQRNETSPEEVVTMITGETFAG